MSGRSSVDESSSQPSLASSWSRRSSFLARQQPNKLNSADYIITVASDASPRSTTVISSSGAQNAVLATVTPSSSAAALHRTPEHGPTGPPSTSSLDVEPSLTTPLLQDHQHLSGQCSSFAAPEQQEQQQEQQQGPFKGSVSKVTTFAVPSCLAAAKSAAAAPQGPRTDKDSAAVAAADTAAAQFQRKLAAAYTLSWIVNIFLLVAKLYAYWISSSKAVLASAADSAVDLVSQVVIAYADWRVGRQDPRFPVGQARLEAIGVLACACIMSVASFEVISESVQVLVDVWQTGEMPVLQLGLVMYIVLGSATGLKLLCWWICRALQHKSDSMLALAEDHLNDIMSNMCAIITAVMASLVSNGWWIDPVGAIAISGYIVARWLAIAKQQVDKIVGRGAPELFIHQLEQLANSHHAAFGLDVIRAYHFGARYIVEMEVVLPAEMTVRDSHDISLDLQNKVEQLDEVERAFVHVDYMKRDGLEHKLERALALAASQRSQSMGSNSRHSASGVLDTAVGLKREKSSSSEGSSHQSAADRRAGPGDTAESLV